MKRYEGLLQIGFVWIWELIGLLGAMSVPIANLLLAIPWGWVFARWAYPGTPEGRYRRAWLLTIHSVIPPLSLTLLPIVLWAGSGGAWGIFSPAAALEYRIPFAFILPFPFNTILGFYWGAALVTVLFKIVVTTALARIAIAIRAHAEANQPTPSALPAGLCPCQEGLRPTFVETMTVGRVPSSAEATGPPTRLTRKDDPA